MNSSNFIGVEATIVALSPNFNIFLRIIYRFLNLSRNLFTIAVQCLETVFISLGSSHPIEQSVNILLRSVICNNVCKLTI